MSRQFYQLAGFIIARRELGEADWLLLVITADYGLIKIVAKGVRLTKSKLRPSLERFRPVQLTVVKGREIWRLVGAERVSGEGLSLPLERLFARLAVLLERLVPPEAPAGELYEELAASFAYFGHLARAGERSGTALAAGETVLVLRILKALGYASPAADLPAELWHSPWNENLIAQAAAVKRQTVTVINQALAASQL